MNQAPKFFADQLKTEDQKLVFWHLIVDWRFSGETAYCMAMSGEKIIPKS